MSFVNIIWSLRSEGWTDSRMITKTSDTKTKLTKTNSRRNSEKNAWTTAKVMGGVTWCQNHFEEKKLTNYIKVIGRLRLRWKKTQPSSKCLFSEVSREWFNWNLLISLPFTQTVELEMIEHGKDVFKCSLYFGQMNCMTYGQINLNQFQTRRTMKEHIYIYM